MANPFEKFKSKSSTNFKKADFKGGSNNPMDAIAKVMTLQMMKDQMAQKQQQKLQQQGGVRTQATVGGETYKFPEGLEIESQQKMQDKQAEESAKVTPKLETLEFALGQMKQQADTIPAVRPGYMQRPLDIIRNKVQGAAGVKPQIEEYNKNVELLSGLVAVAIGEESGNRLSDADRQIFRNFFSRADKDTEDQKHMRFYQGFQFLNAKRSERGLQPIEINKFMPPQETGRARALLGDKNIDQFSDDELKGALGELPGSEGFDENVYARPILERLVEEYERRQLHRQGEQL